MSQISRMPSGTSHRHLGGMSDREFLLFLLLLAMAAVLMMAQPLQSTPELSREAAAALQYLPA